ncbi:early activation antigen CD69-like [Thamnophis elegans]|uniref:early activation antigen CD69-like n=1 Tax=Thamnophis elegans TaxID=35005 RepID=UPI0013781BE0|nr:early activation antigen CD69-like [Thamnophis elegans]
MGPGASTMCMCAAHAYASPPCDAPAARQSIAQAPYTACLCKNGSVGSNTALIQSMKEMLVKMDTYLERILIVSSIFVYFVLLPVRNQSQSSLYLASQNVSCTDSWITYKGKYFYIAREEKDWFMSLKTCSLLNSSLAVIDTQKELVRNKETDFWVHFLGPFDYWFGLSRETNKVWKWANGTEFRNQFPIHGEGLCAYINAEGASSTKCTVEKGFLCSCNKVAAILAKTTSSKVGILLYHQNAGFLRFAEALSINRLKPSLCVQKRLYVNLCVTLV